MGFPTYGDTGCSAPDPEVQPMPHPAAWPQEPSQHRTFPRGGSVLFLVVVVMLVSFSLILPLVARGPNPHRL